MIVIKTARQLEFMKRAGEISAGAIKVARDCLKPGVTTAHVDAAIDAYIREQNATPSFLGYGGFPKSSCISINNEVIHGIPGERVVQSGDIVSIDVGAIYEGFNGDNAATFAVGDVPGETQKLLDVTYESLQRAVEACEVDNRLGDIGYAVQSHVEAAGFSVVRQYVGHGVGKHLHEDPDVPNFGNPGHGVRLAQGMTIAIEPMVNIGSCEVEVLGNDWTVVTLDGSLSAHFEFTIAITSEGPLILTPWPELL